MTTPFPPVPPGPSASALLIDKHVSFIQNLDKKRDELAYYMTEHLRLNGVYWGLTALALMRRQDALPREEMIEWVMSCYDAQQGAFSPHPGHDVHVHPTLSAIQILATQDALHLLDKPRITQYILSLQDPITGSFMGDEWGEVDTRFTYCAVAALALLGTLDQLDHDKTVSYVETCKNFDGGFGMVAGAESHTSWVWTCLGTLAILKRLDVVDKEMLTWWLAERQLPNGGLNGRPEKLPDASPVFVSVCYSWWVLASLAILGRTDNIDGKKLTQFILDCQDPTSGGLSDRPEDQPDVWHTLFGITGLSLLGHEGLDAVDPVYCMPLAFRSANSMRVLLLSLCGLCLSFSPPVFRREADEAAFRPTSFTLDPTQTMPASLAGVWAEEFKAPIQDGITRLTAEFRKKLPEHRVLPVESYGLNLPGFAAAAGSGLSLRASNDSVFETFYQLPTKRGQPGQSALRPDFAFYEASYAGQDFNVIYGDWTVGYVTRQVYWIALPKAHQDAAAFLDVLLSEVSVWSQALREQIWSFATPGQWIKDHSLWESIQGGRWSDIILDPKIKSTIREDIEGFFRKERVYKDLGAPWKRGSIFLGPAGNGKTVSIKALMRDLQEAGIPSLYVRTFTRYGSDLEGIKEIFKKARAWAPCLLIIEDIDSLITDINRSAFLNEVDGLENNDGLYILGTTNHFSKLDGAIKNRPSRFDRKWTFGNPNLNERILYAQYWQNKLQGKHLGFDNVAAEKWAKATNHFSFAYLKESFLSTLLILAGESHEGNFVDVLLSQVEVLRKELEAHDDPDDAAAAAAKPQIPLGPPSFPFP